MEFVVYLICPVLLSYWWEMKTGLSLCLSCFTWRISGSLSVSDIITSSAYTATLSHGSRLFSSCLSPAVRMSITKIHAREILDSRGNPTVEVDLWTEKGDDLKFDVSSF